MKKKALLFLVLLTAIFLSGCQSKQKAVKLSPEELKTKAAAYINENLVSGVTATIKDIALKPEKEKIYKVTVEAAGQTIDSYVSESGFLYPQRFNIAEDATTTAASNQNQPAPISEVTNKTDRPVVELFVMSYCPYGTQIEKGILPVVKLLGDKIDFQLKFCDYAMHEKQELDENLFQYCVGKDNKAQLVSYLGCFLQSGDNTSCASQAGVDKTKTASCVASTDAQYNVSKNYADKNTWQGNYPAFDVYKADNAKYGVSGSPTLVINGETVKSGRDSKSLLDTICSAFKNKPEECSSEISSDTPAPGFGSGTTSNNSSASCN